MATITAVYVRIVARRLRDAGVAMEALFSGTGLDSVAIWTQDEVELGQFRALLSNAEELYEEEPIGFLIGGHHSTRALGQVGTAMSAAPDVRSGFQALATFSALHTTYIRAQVTPAVSGMRLSLLFDDEIGDALRAHVEATLMLLKRFVEDHTARRLDAARFELPYGEPGHAALYRRVLGAGVTFDRDVAAVFVPNAWLDLPSPFYYAEIWNQSLRQLSQRIKEIGATDDTAYQRHIRALMRSRPPPLPVLSQVAARLHVSERTLNRRLREEGTSFRQLRTELLDEWARNYLQETGDSVEAIAGVLGYQDTANFRRAFRARHGMSPGAFRESTGGKMPDGLAE